jgi:hypothetical protein
MADVMSAVAPRYPEDPKGVVIDLNQLDDLSPSFIEGACQEVSRRVSDLYEQCIDGRRCGHVSVFGIAPIPVVCLQEGTVLQNVALMLSLSGTIQRVQLPPEIDDSYTIYELTLENVAPSPTFLNHRTDLEAFRLQYQITLRTLAAKHTDMSKLRLFPAIPAPAPVAILCGRELLPKVDPSVVIYDYQRGQGGFIKTITINQDRKS